MGLTDAWITRVPPKIQQPVDAQLGSGAVLNIPSVTTSKRLLCRDKASCIVMAAATSRSMGTLATSVDVQRSAPRHDILRKGRSVRSALCSSEYMNSGAPVTQG